MTDLMGRGPLGQKTGKKPKSRKPMNRVSEKRAKEAHPLRKNAKGKHCTFRFTGCEGASETVVFAHYRRFGWAGAAQKPNDLLGAFSCASCHEKQERHHPEATYEELLRAMGETLLIQYADGKIAFCGD
jgi:hypothetical protein